MEISARYIFLYIACIKLRPIYICLGHLHNLFITQEILDMKALIVKQHEMLDDTRRRMTKGIISLEREVRVSLRVHMTICTLFTYLLVNNLIYSHSQLN